MKYNRNGTRLRRRLSVQHLETRQLLTAEIFGEHNDGIPEDVNNDGGISAMDALMVINRLGHHHDKGDSGIAFYDVNDDGRVTVIDALRVINRLRAKGMLQRDTGNGDPKDGVFEVRSIDGTGNNLNDPRLGAAGSELLRIVDAAYTDGISQPSGEGRLSAREISNIVAVQSESVLNDRNLSDLIWQWGQFIDHDITLSEASEDESLDILVPIGDPFFDPSSTGVEVIGMTRSAVFEGTGIDSIRQQVNDVTAFIDASMVYGSDLSTTELLRSFDGGKMRTSEGNLLPLDDEGFFLAGDIRVNEQNGLTSMHTLWVREHNRLADQIAAENPSLLDEAVFQRARRIVIAEIQAITFNEYLPTQLGSDAIPRYLGYDSSIDPSISNVFATAAFRYGHTSLTSEFKRLNNDGNVIDEGNILLRDAFFNPAEVIQVGIEPYLKGFASNVSQEVDSLIVDDVRNFLFGPPGAGGFDLAALNIQRGRDHGLPDYNTIREQLGLSPFETFADITSDPEIAARLAAAYETVEEMDVWVAMLAEDHVAGASVSELTRAILVEQFTRLRDGDRLWYENVFKGRELAKINATTLADVIERNTHLTTIQKNAFIVPV